MHKIHSTYLFLKLGAAVVVGGEEYVLWSGPEIENRTAPFLDRVTHITAHKARAGEYQFLHGAAVIWHDGVLHASWANSLVDENSATETLRTARSIDGGWSWSEPGFIGPGFPGDERHSHGSFLSHDGRLLAFAARFGGESIGTDAREVTFTNLRMEVFVWDKVSETWQSLGIAANDFWPMDEPKRLPGARWIMGGLSGAEGPLVAISEGEDFMRWRVVRIPVSSDRKLRFAETTVVVAEAEIVAIVRNTGVARALVSTSRDNGETWTQVAEANYPMGTSKPYAGTLSTGQRYLVSNLFEGRETLGIAVSRPNGSMFERVWRIRQGITSQPRFAGRAKSAQWSYPYAHEHDGNLYVVYSIGKEDCGLSIIPISALAVE